jgi:hypothetical protein
MKPNLILCLALVLSGGLSAYGLSVEIPVTSNNLDQGQCAFSISNNGVKDGVSFHVTIIAKNSGIISNSTAALSIVTHWANGSGSGSEIIGAKHVTQITVKKDNRIEEADFNVSRELLKNTDLYFIFAVYLYDTTKDGRRIPMASADFYEIRLRDFLK